MIRFDFSAALSVSSKLSGISLFEDDKLDNENPPRPPRLPERPCACAEAAVPIRKSNMYRKYFMGCKDITKNNVQIIKYANMPIRKLNWHIGTSMNELLIFSV